MVITTAPLPSQILANAPESVDYQMVYTLPLYTYATNWDVYGAPYAIDNRNTIGLYSRVAYYMEVATNAAGPTSWVYVAAAAFNTNANRIGVPVLGSGSYFQQKLATNGSIFASTNLALDTTLTNNLSIEFGPLNYSVATSTVVIGGSTTAYDNNDTFTAHATAGSTLIGNAGGIRLYNDVRGQVEKLAAIGQLAATVAHEIRNPITGAKCLLQQVPIATDAPTNEVKWWIKQELFWWHSPVAVQRYRSKQAVRSGYQT